VLSFFFSVELWACTLVSLLGYCLFWYTQQPNAPGPLKLPFVGSPDFIKNRDRNEWFVEATRRFGNKTWTAGIPGLGTVIAVVDPSTVEHVLKTNFENYIKGPEWIDRFALVLGQGIFNVDGLHWKLQRKTASHMFNVKTLSTWMLETFIEHGHNLSAKFKADPDQELDMQDYLARYTIDSISKIAFGISLGSIASDGKQTFEDALRAPAGGVEGPTFGRAFDAAQEATTWRFLLPFWKLRNRLQTPTEAKLSLAVKVMNKFAQDLIQQRRKEGDLEGRKDVLAWFMLLKDDDGKPFSDDYLRDIIMNFMIAGRDTTANALTWVFFFLGHHPEVVTQLREELNEHGLDHPGCSPTWESLKMMKYHEAVVKETLRMYPSVPKDLKYAVADDVLPDGTKVRAGQNVAYLPLAQGRVETLWGKECDFRSEKHPDGFPYSADTFYPDRWMDEEFKPNAFYYPVFQAGLRTCLGKDMAYLEMKTLIAMLVASFDFVQRDEFLTEDTVSIANTVTCPIKGGLHGKMVPRVK